MAKTGNTTIQPLGWAPPRGYANGILGQGQTLFIAGQIGWDPRSRTPVLSDSFIAQFEQALMNVMEVLRTAGGQAENLARVTIYVTDKTAYQRELKAVGDCWRRRIGKHYPAMTLVEVKGLLEPLAQVEIEATALL